MNKNLKFGALTASFLSGLVLSGCTTVVSPNSKENAINGLQSEYSVNCGSQFKEEEAAVSSLSGDLSYVFYTDEAMTKKYYDIKFDGLCASINGGTTANYWVKVIAGGGATGYKEVFKTAKITATCVESSVPNIPTDCISYKSVSCEYCKGPMGEGAPMEDQDVVLMNKNGENITFNYGLKPGSYVKEKTTDEPFEVGDFRYGFYDNETKVNYFYLPLIDFKAHSDRDIVIKFRTNNRPSWGQKFAVHLGIDEEATNLFDGSTESNWNEDPNACFVLNYSTEENVLKMSCIGRGEKTVEIDDQEIIEGKKNIVIYGKGSSRSVTLYNGCILLNHSHEWSDDFVAPSDKIGYKVRQCEVCKHKELSDVPMASSDVKFTSSTAYGANAHMLITVEQEGNRGILGGLLWQGGDGEGITSIAFPKINYTAFSNVIFEFGTSSATWVGGYVKLSINSENDLLDIPSGVAGVYGSITAQYDEASKSLSLTSLTSTGLTKTVVVTDENVINGTSSLSGVASLGNWRCFYLNKIIMDHAEHSGSGSPIGSSVRIGHKVEKCVDCLLEVPSEEIMSDADIDLSKGYGVGNEGLSGFHGYDGQKVVLSDGSNGVGKVLMPRVEFSAYSCVRFSMYYAPLWGKIGFDADHNFGYYGDGSKDTVIYLDITKTAEGYNAVLSCPGKGDSLSTVVVDQDVIDGTSSFGLYHSQGAYSFLCLSSVSVAE
ncbi:MAG: hypothetical protein MJ239_03560 [Bacilli bacterium]|nr:hypothetical protein [Bacilli bacterium]